MATTDARPVKHPVTEPTTARGIIAHALWQAHTVGYRLDDAYDTGGWRHYTLKRDGRPGPHFAAPPKQVPR